MLHKFQCGLCNESYYGECVRHLAVRSGEHVGISPLTNKRVQRIRDRGVPSFVKFQLFTHCSVSRE